MAEFPIEGEISLDWSDQEEWSESTSRIGEKNGGSI